MQAKKRTISTGNRGVSVLLALLVFLIVSLTGVAVFTMAASNKGNSLREREAQAAYLTVASAIKLLRSELDAFKVTVAYELGADGSYSLDGGNTTVAGTGIFGPMESALIESCKAHSRHLSGAGDVFDRTLKFVMDPKSAVLSSAAEGGVEVALSIRAAEGGLSLEFVFGYYRGEGDERTVTDSYRTRMTVAPSALEETPAGGASGSNLRVYGWDAAHAPIVQAGAGKEAAG